MCCINICGQSKKSCLHPLKSCSLLWKWSWSGLMFLHWIINQVKNLMIRFTIPSNEVLLLLGEVGLHFGLITGRPLPGGTVVYQVVPCCHKLKVVHQSQLKPIKSTCHYNSHEHDEFKILFSKCCLDVVLYIMRQICEERNCGI